MSPIFADTFYYLAIVNREDAAHARALALSRRVTAPTVTTAWVLTEVADALAAPRQRRVFLVLLESLRDDPQVAIVPPTQDLFDRGVTLYRRRPDRGWSLTDCISFVVMDQMQMTEALTGDRHFEQAGFQALLK